MAPTSSKSRLLPLYLFLAFSMSSVLFLLHLNSWPRLNGCRTNPGRCLSIPDNFIPANRRLCSDLDNSTNATESSNQFDTEWGDETSQISLDLRYRQYGRKKLILNLCDNNVTLGHLKKVTFSDIHNNQLTNLVVDDRNGILYCYVPKVASTEWKRVMIFLSQSLKDNGVPYRSHSDIPMELTHENVIHLNGNKKEIQCKIKKYKKFLFVRNPFVRLISAYRDKFEKVNEGFYRYYAVPIMKKYGKKPIDLPDNAEKAYKLGLRPSFSQFIQYLLDLDASEYQEHWKPVYHLCHPCEIQYDFVGKMETLHEDPQHLLQLLKADHIVHFPPTSGHQVEESWINVWYSKIPNEWRWKIYKIYEADFKLFGYSVPENFLNASQMEWN